MRAMINLLNFVLALFTNIYFAYIYTRWNLQKIKSSSVSIRLNNAAGISSFWAMRGTFAIYKFQYAEACHKI